MKSRCCKSTEASTAHAEWEARPRRRDHVFPRSADRWPDRVQDRHVWRASTKRYVVNSSARKGRRSSTVMLFRTACPALQITCAARLDGLPSRYGWKGRSCLGSLHEYLVIDLGLAQRRRRQEARRLRRCYSGRVRQRSPERRQFAKNAWLHQRHTANTRHRRVGTFQDGTGHFDCWTIVDPGWVGI
jgi:hypothetical protein